MNPRQRYFRSACSPAGFTLLEILVTLVLLGIMAGLTVPALGGMASENKIERSLDRVAADLTYARMLAIRSGSPVVMRFDGGTSAGNAYRIVLDDGTEVRRVDLAGEYRGVEVTAPADNNQEIWFNSRGIIASTLANQSRFTATHDGRSGFLGVTLAGGIYRGY
ncbi:MAG: GspH/FimT family pseudopilin [Longimicrobiaceae bacterium]